MRAEPRLLLSHRIPQHEGPPLLRSHRISQQRGMCAGPPLLHSHWSLQLSASRKLLAGPRQKMRDPASQVTFDTYDTFRSRSKFKCMGVSYSVSTGVNG